MMTISSSLLTSLQVSLLIFVRLLVTMINDLDDELHRFDFYHDGTMSVIEREDNGRWKRDDDIGVYGFRRDGFFYEDRR